MSLVAAFLWRKSPQPSICTFIYDNESIQILSPPKIFFFSKKLFSFRKEAKKIITTFMLELNKLSHLQKNSIILEYKIVFNVSNIPWIKVSGESKFIHKYFIQSVNKLQKKVNHVKLQSQLRNKLSGKSLKHFKRELRKMNLVSRKRDTGFEYQLWMVALHATAKTYEKKLKIIKQKILNAFWNQP